MVFNNEKMMNKKGIALAGVTLGLFLVLGGLFLFNGIVSAIIIRKISNSPYLIIVGIVFLLLIITNLKRKK